ncbi:YmdB family metallophosphoesterase [Candidatus Saccharibacteria bacterium]|nr:YmdB family metallophosphoesterase [Candidatus Saccharibacteria bacterium]
MNILYVGDVMGEVGIKVIEKILPKLRQTKGIDLVVAQAENVSDGKSMTVADYRRLKKAGVDAFTGGNHTPTKEEIIPLLNDPKTPVMGPANMPDCPGPGYKYVNTIQSIVLVISLLGQTVGKGAGREVNNPLKAIDKILEQEKATKKDAIVINFHGDFSSEKVVIGHYLDGRASVVVGDHWHVPTADARVLPGRTAHMTDVGMCGALNSSLGVTYDSIVPRWRDGKQTKNQLETNGPTQFNAVLVSVGENGLADSIEHIQQIFD